MTKIIQIGNSVDPKITQIGNVIKISFRSEVRWSLIKNNKYHSDRKFDGPQNNLNRECIKIIIQIGNHVDPCQNN